MWPLLPLIFGSGVIGGIAFLCWYECLSSEEKERADRLAADVARELFERTLDQLSFEERQRVYRETRTRFF